MFTYNFQGFQYVSISWDLSGEMSPYWAKNVSRCKRSFGMTPEEHLSHFLTVACQYTQRCGLFSNSPPLSTKWPPYLWWTSLHFVPLRPNWCGLPRWWRRPYQWKGHWTQNQPHWTGPAFSLLLICGLHFPLVGHLVQACQDAVRLLLEALEDFSGSLLLHFIDCCLRYRGWRPRNEHQGKVEGAKHWMLYVFDSRGHYITMDDRCEHRNTSLYRKSKSMSFK